MDKSIDLSKLSEEDILNLRICDLPLKIQGIWLEDCVSQLYKELDEKDVRFKPLCYLADEWLTPDQEPVIAIPFYLADSTLTKLEKKMMLEAEGETREECMKLLRHETGHAINYAYKLYKKRKWQKIFGSFSEDYPDTYKFRPYSKSFVRHLSGHYAQYHPDEDFTETFAVWLTPGLDWQTQYKGWKALNKLKYVDQLINDLKDKEPLVKKGKKYWQVSTMRCTLQNYYKKKRKFREEDFPEYHDPQLKRIFQLRDEENKKAPFATSLITKYRKDIINHVSFCTGEKKYVINSLIKEINQRCRQLKMVYTEEESPIVGKLSTYITTLIMNYIYTGWFRGEQ